MHARQLGGAHQVLRREAHGALDPGREDGAHETQHEGDRRTPPTLRRDESPANRPIGAPMPPAREDQPRHCRRVAAAITPVILALRHEEALIARRPLHVEEGELVAAEGVSEHSSLHQVHRIGGCLCEPGPVHHLV